MVHHIRKQEGRKNTTVYGCVSDSRQFFFLRIDNESKVKYSSSTFPPPPPFFLSNYIDY